MPDHYVYPAILPRQGNGRTVFCFSAPASQVLGFSAIDRIGRTGDGVLKGFQRPQVAEHIKEIRRYLVQESAILPNSVVIAFTRGVSIAVHSSGVGEVRIDASLGPPGLVVDGQQRLSALSGLPEKDFEVIVCGLLCDGEEELRKQFILINNTRPLPKPLIYELLPTVSGLPHRLSSRAKAAALVERLNYDENSSLHGQIKQHTNPTGVIKDTSMQRVIINSLADGALREFSYQERGSDNADFLVLSNFFGAVQRSFPEDWKGHTPKTSRLVHGAGIISMGYVMEYLQSTLGAFEAKEFLPGLELLKGNVAWTSGYWKFGVGNQRPWNQIQNLSRDWVELSQYLIGTIKRGYEKQKHLRVVR